MAAIEQGSSGNLTPLLTGVNILPYNILGNGLVTVTNAGTAQVLGSSTVISTVTLRALSTNTGLIYVGTSSVSSANGFELSPNETISLDISNLNKIYIDAQISGNGITYITLT